MPETPDLNPNDAPDALRSALRGLFAEAPPVHSRVDEAVLSEARRRLHSSRRVPIHLSRIVWPAAAAVALLATLSVIFVARPQHAPSAALAMRAEDIDADGAVTVLDAFTVARTLRDARPTQPSWDVTRDGRIDDRDIRHIMTVAVALPPETPSQRGADRRATP